VVLRRRLLTLTAAAAFSLGGAAPARAQYFYFTVNSTLDNPDVSVDGLCADQNGNCTLRAAVMEANAHPGAGAHTTVTLHGGLPYTLTRPKSNPDDHSNGDLDVVVNLQINGDGPETTIIDGNLQDRVFHVGGSGSLFLHGVTIRKGYPWAAVHFNGGGAILVDAGGHLELTRCVIEMNDSSISGSGGGISVLSGANLFMVQTTVRMNKSGLYSGGGVSATGAMTTIRQSTISQNSSGAPDPSAQGFGGGFSQVSGGSSSIENTTFCFNGSTGFGGGIGISGTGATMKLNNVTFAGNEADSNVDGSGTGGGIYVESDTTVTLSNSILENVNDFTHGFDDCSGTLTTTGYTIFATTGGCTIPFGNYTVGDALGSAVLKNNGGPTETVVPPSNSPAVGGGNPNGCYGTDNQLLYVDQRGVNRPIGLACDLGAVEVEPIGDVNGDGVVNVADVFYLINFLFAGGPIPLGRANVNGDSAINVSDVFYLINFLFAGGPAPA
jgi:hypothetical protein